MSIVSVFVLSEKLCIVYLLPVEFNSLYSLIFYVYMVYIFRYVFIHHVNYDIKCKKKKKGQDVQLGSCFNRIAPSFTALLYFYDLGTLLVTLS